MRARLRSGSTGALQVEDQATPTAKLQQRDGQAGAYRTARGLLTVVAFLLASPGLPAIAQDAKSSPHGELILSNLPPRGSKAYKDLLSLADNEARGQILSFSKSEMWSMPESRINEVIRKSTSLGATQRSLVRIGTTS